MKSFEDCSCWSGASTTRREEAHAPAVPVVAVSPGAKGRCASERIVRNEVTVMRF